MVVRLLGGVKKTHRAVNPSLQFDLTTRPGDANVKSVAVTLPSAFEIDQRHLGNLCTEKELAATPVRRTPDDRHSYHDHSDCSIDRSQGRRTRSPVRAACRASPSSSTARSTSTLDADASTVSGGRLRTTVPVVPDISIGHFHLVVFGGKHGYLSNTRSLCANVPRAEVSFVGQNGKTLTQRVPVKTSCGARLKSAKRHARRHS